MNRVRLTAGIKLAAFFVCVFVMANSALATNESVHGLSTRTLSLFELGLKDEVSLNSRNFEQHFYFPVPQEVELTDATIEVHGIYLHPFAGTAAVTLMVNGTPVLSRPLQDAQGGAVVKFPDLGSYTLSNQQSGEKGNEINISLPLPKSQNKQGFIDVGVVLSSQIDATRCIDERGRGNEFMIDPKSTRLSYSFEGNSIKSIRSLLTALPRHPVILLPSRNLTALRYGTALKLSQSLLGMGLQPEFATIPQVGDIVATSLVAKVVKNLNIQVDGAMGDAIAQEQPYKITQLAEASVWLKLRMLSTDGFAHVIVDSTQTRQALLAVFQGEGAEKWLPEASLDKANLRVAMLAGQPVLALDGLNMERGAELINTTWRNIAGTPELALATAQHMPDKDSPQPHIHFARNFPVQSVAERAEWVVPVSLSALPQGKWPDSFDLNLMAAPSGDGIAPVVSVFMNDNLLTAVAMRTDGEITRVRAHIPLYALRANNQLRVEVRRRVLSAHCSGVAQGYPVQLLPSSYLNLRDAPLANEFFMLSTEFGRDSELVIPASYLSNAVNTLPTVSSVLRGLSMGETDFKLVTDAGKNFKPSHSFVAFETAADSDTQLVVTESGRLVVRNVHDHTVFDSVGLGNLAVLQVIQSAGHHGAIISTLNGVLPALKSPLELSAGNLAIADASGVRLAINLDDSESDWLLDEQNRGVLTYMQRYRIWFIVLGVVLLMVGIVFGLRWHYRKRQLQA